MKIKNKLWTYGFLCVLEILHLIRLATCVVFAPLSRVVENVPDDAFYYLQLSRQHAQVGIWSLNDSDPTTGFHLIHAYFMSSIWKIMPHADVRTVLAITGLASLLLLAFSFLMIDSVARDFNSQSNYFPFHGIVFLLPGIFLQSHLMMESMWVIFFSSLLIFLVVHKIDNRRLPQMMLLCGMLGVFARTDFLILTTAFAFAAIAGTKFQRQRFRGNRILRASIFGFIGSLLGMAMVSLHCLLVSGNLSQGSSTTKLIWTSKLGITFHKVTFLALESITGWPSERHVKVGVLLVSVVLGWSLLVAVRNRRHRSRDAFKPEEFAARQMVTLGVSIAGTLFGISFFVNSHGFQIWYLSLLVAPIAIVAASLVNRLPHRYISIAFLGSLLGASLNFFYTGFLHSAGSPFTFPWPNSFANQRSSLLVSETLSEYPEGVVFGSWNAGIVSVFSGRTIVNLDGLTNDSVIPYIRRGKLGQYVAERGITMIVDYEKDITSATFARRGGFPDSWLDDCLIVIDSKSGLTSGREAMLVAHVASRCPDEIP